MIYVLYNINENKLKLNKMCYISFYRKVNYKFSLKKSKIGQFLGGVFGHESFTLNCYSSASS